MVAVRRFETPPGKQAQVDWGHLGTLELDGQEQKLHGFTFTLGYSRRMMAEAALDQKLGTLLRMHEAAFQQIGGVPEEILYDRMKTVWLGTDERGEIVWNPVFLDFARYWGFTPRLCRPYRAQTKGKVEVGREVRAAELPVRVARARAGQSERSECADAEWVWDVANQRVHGTTHEQVAVRWDADQFSLQPLRASALPLCGWRAAQGGAGRLCGLARQPLFRALAVCGQGSVGARDRRRSGGALRPGADRGARPAQRKHSVLTFPPHHQGIPLGGRSAPGKILIHMRQSAPVVEKRPLAAYESVANGGGR